MKTALGALELEHGEIQGVDAFHRGEGDGEVLDGEAGRIEGRDLLVGLAAGHVAGQDCTELNYVREKRMIRSRGGSQLAVMARLLPVVAEDLAAGELLHCDLRLARAVGSHQTHVLAAAE